MSGGEVSPEGTRQKRSTVTDVEARYSSGSLPACLPAASLARIPAFHVKQEGTMQCSSLPSERQLDHLRRHYLSLFLCNFPLRTPTCQMTNPKATSWHCSRPRRGFFELRRTKAGRGREKKTDHHRRPVDAALRRPFEKGPQSTLRFLTNEGFCGGEGGAATPPTPTMIIISSRIFSVHKQTGRRKGMGAHCALRSGRDCDRL